MSKIPLRKYWTSLPEILEILDIPAEILDIPFGNIGHSFLDIPAENIGHPCLQDMCPNRAKAVARCT